MFLRYVFLFPMIVAFFQFILEWSRSKVIYLLFRKMNSQELLTFWLDLKGNSKENFSMDTKIAT